MKYVSYNGSTGIKDGHHVCHQSNGGLVSGQIVPGTTYSFNANSYCLYVANTKSLSRVTIVGSEGGGRLCFKVTDDGTATTVSVGSKATVNLDLTGISMLAYSTGTSTSGSKVKFTYTA